MIWLVEPSLKGTTHRILFPSIRFPFSTCSVWWYLTVLGLALISFPIFASPEVGSSPRYLSIFRSTSSTLESLFTENEVTPASCAVPSILRQSTAQLFASKS